MKTIVAKTAEIERKWYLIDASEAPLGKVAVVAAKFLRGKEKTNFSPHVDMGDGVIIINANELKLSGNKWEDKKYYSHSGYLGSLKTTSASKMKEKDVSYIIKDAVRGMIPKNKLRDDIMKRLRIFETGEHNLSAQQPEKFSF